MRVLIEEVAHGYIDERHKPVEENIFEEGLTLFITPFEKTNIKT